MKAFTFVAGLAAGYVLGTRAGREKYEQIVEGARNLAEQPTVVQAQAKIKDLVGAGKDAVTSKITSATSDDDAAATPAAVPAPASLSATTVPLEGDL
jgi:hypothetical protein